MKYKSISISSKWTKNGWLLQNRDLRQYLPPSGLFNRSNLAAMLSDFAVVYFKPTTGSGGNHIIRIRKQDSGYQSQIRTSRKFHPSLDHLFNYLNGFAHRRPYLLQKGIRLAKTNGHPFDIRVMVQKTNEGKWVSTGIFAKIGKPGIVATNYNQGGKIGFLRPTLSAAGYGETNVRQLENELKRMGTAVGKCFDKHKRGFRELGLDVALDTAGKPWILEVNTRPQFYPLKHMKDPSMYHRIVSYAKQYDRSK